MSEQTTPPTPTEMPVQNSLSDFVSGMYASGTGAFQQRGVQLSQTDTMFINNRWYLLSNFRQLLSQIYVEHGIVQTLVDQPVDDAFRAGIEIKTSQLDGDDIEKLTVYIERHQVIARLMQALKWARLYGGGAIIIVTNQDPVTPLNINSIGEDTPIDFIAADMWELYGAVMNIPDVEITEGDGKLKPDLEFYDYYGKKIHHSRVYKVNGKEAPSFVKPRLRGWGMSELERVVRSINQYMKNQDVIFDLLDEAKIDVYKMKGFNTALSNKDGTTKVTQRVQSANMIKNYQHAITMDSEDDYVQKQITFTGLSEVLTQIRQGIAADLKMPLTKLFGISSAGFNSGEDDIENYNSMIEGEIRAKCKFIVADMVSLCCRKVFGFAPDDLIIKFPPLRILSAKEEEEVKDRQFNRTMSAYTTGLMDGFEAKEALNRASLLPAEVDESKDALPPIAGVNIDETNKP